MSLSDTMATATPWPHSLRLLLQVGALLLLCPLYWQITVPAADVLLGLVQGLIAAGSVHEWRLGKRYCLYMAPADWMPAACGGYVLELDARLHCMGNAPDVRIMAESPTLRRLIDPQGNIHIFSERPLRGRIEVRHGSDIRKQAGGR
jgi:hypothetical protein